MSNAVVAPTLTVRDRTAELHAAVAAMHRAGGSTKGSSASPERSRLMMAGSSGNISGIAHRSDFARKAKLTNQEILGLTSALDHLAQLSRKRSLFDDQPAEFNRLISVVKQKIAESSRLISELSNARQQQQNSPNLGGPRNRQADEHAANVISSLQSKLASSSNEFKSILEVRTQAMREQKFRRDQYSVGQIPKQLLQHPSRSEGLGYRETSFNPTPPPLSPNSSGSGLASTGPLARPAVGQAAALAFSAASASSAGEVTLGGRNVQQQQQQQQQLNFANQEYAESRSLAIESIESTIAELGQMYSHFAQILSQQREVIQRIDDNVIDVEMNVTGAHDQLVRYFQNISSNRWLMLKVLAVLVVFFLLFVLIT
ncbi:t-SNARE [Zopfochytrium polystomum]|nr:t-SNARE [Zopfochytrium polystomum]